MNFFPNLQIIVNIPSSGTAPSVSTHPRPQQEISLPMSNAHTSHTSQTSSSSSSNSSPTVSQIIQRILRPTAAGSAPIPITQLEETGSTLTNDMHFYVNLDSYYPPPSGMTIEQIHEMTELSVRLPSSSSNSASEMCTICQNTCETGSIVQTIRQCRHTFHPVCIERWLIHHNSCPVCRSALESPTLPT
jgi:hypothetical protein